MVVLSSATGTNNDWSDYSLANRQILAGIERGRTKPAGRSGDGLPHLAVASVKNSHHTFITAAIARYETLGKQQPIGQYHP
jgi:hypothetical protein